MACVIVTGLPKNVKTAKVPKFIFLFKAYFKQRGLPPRFWIIDMNTMRNSNMKEMTIEFESIDDAYVGQEILDKFSYYDKTDSKTYVFSASVDEKSFDRSARGIERPQRPESRRGESRWERSKRSPVKRNSLKRSWSRERYRSRSPISNKASQLDLELELLKKQRMVIEEERRLLLERKKLELIQEYGPSAVNEFKSDFDFVAPRQSPPRRRQDPKPKPKPQSEKPRLRKSRPFIPKFILPCKIITNEMKSLIAKHAGSADKYMLENLIRLNLRKRIAVALETKEERLSSKEIVDLYRKLYPKSTDEALVNTAVRNIEQSHISELLSKENKAKEPSPECWDEDDTKPAIAGESNSIVKDSKENENKTLSIDENNETTDNGIKKSESPKVDMVDNLNEAEIANVKTIIEPGDKENATTNDVKEQAGEIDRGDSDVTSAVKDDVLKPNSDELLDENIAKDDIEDWTEDGDDWNATTELTD